MIPSPDDLKAVLEYAQAIERAVDAVMQGTATEADLARIHAANQSRRADVLGQLDELDRRDAAQQ